MIETIYEIPGSTTYSSNQGKNWPLNYMPTGEYTVFYQGYIYGRTWAGGWWSDTTSTYPPDMYTGTLYVGSDGMDYRKYDTPRGNGYAIRCVVRS